MNGVSGHNTALYGKTGPGRIWVNELNFCKSFEKPVELKLSLLQLCHKNTKLHHNNAILNICINIKSAT